MPTDGREQNLVLKQIAQGINDYDFGRANNPDFDAENLRLNLADQFKPLDNALETLPNPGRAEKDLMLKLAAMVDLAKSFGGADYAAADALRSVLIGKVIQRGGMQGAASLQHEIDEGDPYFDVIRLSLENQTGKKPSIHHSYRSKTTVPDLNTPLPLLKPEIVQALKDIVPSEEVDRPTHERHYSTGETENLWRIAARAEYLITLRKLQKAGIDLPAVASLVLENTDSVKKISAFLYENTQLTALQLAEKWGGETYSPPQPTGMSKALKHQDQLAQQLKAEPALPVSPVPTTSSS